MSIKIMRALRALEKLLGIKKFKDLYQVEFP